MARLGAFSICAALVACGPSESANQKIIAPPKASASAQVTGTCPSHIEHPRAITSAAPPPASWVVRDAPAPASETIECANLSQREWLIIRKNEAIDVQLRTKDDEGDPLPFPFHPTKKDEAALHGTHHVHAVPEGFLVGFDAGEYGGALYLFSTDGSTRQKLGSENVIGFADLRIGTIVLTGLAHLGMSVGHLFKVAHGGSGISVSQWLDLGGATETFAVDSPESMFVLTTGALYRVTACGDINEISRTNYDALYPSSMAVDASGVITIGMRQFIARWIPTTDSYRQEWLTKSDCMLMVRDKFECKCRGGS